MRNHRTEPHSRGYTNVRVAIDYRPALRQPTGIGWYIRWLLDAMIARHPDIEWYVFSSSYRDRLHLPWSAPNVHPVDRRWSVRLLDYLWTYWHWPAFENFLPGPVDLVHVPYPQIVPLRSGTPIVATIHDLWLFHTDRPELQKARSVFERHVQWIIHHAHLILVPTYHIASQIVAHHPEVADRLRVIPHGCPPDVAPDRVPDVRDDPRFAQLPERYILFVGALNARKDPGTAVAVIDRLRWEGLSLPLVIVGDGPLRATLLRRIRVRQLPVYILGYVDRRYLPALYSRARLLLVTSQDEGFGFPILEAMAMGVPVVARRVPVLTEIAGPAAVFVEDHGLDGWVTAVHQVWTDDALHARLQCLGRERVRFFRWETTAEQTWTAYREVLE